MKTFKQILGEVQQPRTNGEKLLKALHKGDDPDYPIDGTEKQFSVDTTSTKKKRLADKDSIAPEDKALNEAKSRYELYHKDFSTAMKHAYEYADKKYGIKIDSDEIDDKVATGPSKPSSGKTNRYRLLGTDSKGKKVGVQIQVANLDNEKYELNMYQESVSIDESSDLLATPPKEKPVKVGQKATTPSHIGRKYPDNNWVVKKNTGTSKAYRPLEWVLSEKVDGRKTHQMYSKTGGIKHDLRFKHYRDNLANKVDTDVAPDVSIEESLQESNIDTLKKIVKNRSADTLKFSDGGHMRVDLFTASAVMSLYDSINVKNKSKMENSIDANETNFMKMVDFAFSKNK